MPPYIRGGRGEVLGLRPPSAKMTEIFRRCLVKVVGPEPVLTETARAVPRVTQKRYLVRMTSSSFKKKKGITTTLSRRQRS